MSKMTSSSRNDPCLCSWDALWDALIPMERHHSCTDPRHIVRTSELCTTLCQHCCECCTRMSMSGSRGLRFSRCHGSQFARMPFANHSFLLVARLGVFSFTIDAAGSVLDVVGGRRRVSDAESLQLGQLFDLHLHVRWCRGFSTPFQATSIDPPVLRFV